MRFLLLKTKMENIFKDVLCREAQLMELLNLIGEKDEPLPCSIFISGNTATGKTLCIETIVKKLGYKHVFLNCVECYPAKTMFDMILDGLGSEEESKCDSLKDLVTNLNQLQTIYKNYEPIILVFDKAERFRTMDLTLLSTFMRLREFCTLNICTIFVTNLIYKSFIQMDIREPIKIYFNNYNLDQLLQIIFTYQNSFLQYIFDSHKLDEDIKSELSKPELFRDFLVLFLNIFYRPCRDLTELRHMAKVNFAKYCEPIIKNEVKSNNLNKLFVHISPILKVSLDLLYLRTNRYNEHGQWNETKDIVKKDVSKSNLSYDFPYYIKYLLISAYLSSYNPPKEDKRLFMKHHGKQRKRLQQVKAKAKISEKLNTQLGPKVFTLHRLLAIFYAIVENRAALTGDMMSEIATLVELKLIIGSKEIDFDSTKYKCAVSYDFISKIADSVGFNIRKYLYDFL